MYVVARHGHPVEFWGHGYVAGHHGGVAALAAYEEFSVPVPFMKRDKYWADALSARFEWCYLSKAKYDGLLAASEIDAKLLALEQKGRKLGLDSTQMVEDGSTTIPVVGAPAMLVANGATPTHFVTPESLETYFAVLARAGVSVPQAVRDALGSSA